MKVICQKWEESERGWGVRPDGYSLHLTEEDRKEYINKYNASLPEEVPDEYSRVSGTPYECEIDENHRLAEELREAKKSGIRFHKFGIRIYDNQYPGDGGSDGWRNIKT